VTHIPHHIPPRISCSPISLWIFAIDTARLQRDYWRIPPSQLHTDLSQVDVARSWILEEGLRKVRNATVFDFGNIPRIFRIKTFQSTPPKPVNAPGECPGPFIPPLVPSVISTPGRWHSTVGNTRSVHGLWPCLCGAPNSQFHNFQSRICMPTQMPLTLSINKLGIYAAPAEILPRPDGGLQRPTPFAPHTSLALHR
jgi:hypothetical protein